MIRSMIMYLFLRSQKAIWINGYIYAYHVCVFIGTSHPVPHHDTMLLLYSVFPY